MILGLYAQSSNLFDIRGSKYSTYKGMVLKVTYKSDNLPLRSCFMKYLIERFSHNIM